MSLDPTYQSLQINLRSDDPAIQGQTLGDTELLFNFNRTITIPEDYHLNICVASAEIPHSWYTWDEVLIARVSYTTSGGTNQTFNISVPIRNWTPCCFANFYATEASSLAPDDLYPRLTFDPHTLKWTQTAGTSSDCQIRFFKVYNLPTVESLSLPTIRMVYKFFGLNL